MGRGVPCGTTPPFLRGISECFGRQVLNPRRLGSSMKSREEAADSWLDQYPAEVLEAVLQILQAQRDQDD